ncbi:hypothetical protein IQ22_04214 [Pseudomonas duriflava]|uniref:Uncharacterized protein n=1 Tax=Pseudomonas duriflava TaxID=459528 RepID=A0A562PUA2_9PSED|nr:hypothetical protein [Pseudomonas duriflava]TWI48021.1 hypothetical protein IQ22_04214 [Pseudomonas duriflava]
MNKTWMTGLAGCLVSLTMQTYAGELTDETDTFRERRSVVWTGEPSADDLTFSLLANQSETSSGNKNTFYTAKLSSSGKSARFPGCFSSRWTVDGDPFPALDGRYKLNTFREIYGEDFSTSVSRESLERIVAAKRVEFRACDVRGTLSADDRQGIQRVLDATN